MAFPLVNFESSNAKKELRKSLKESRSLHLEKVKNDYERDQRKKQKQKERGEDRWMLPSVDHRIEKEEKSLKSKKKKKEKKKKKHKEKKSKKHKHREEDSESSDDDSESSWVESGPVKESKQSETASLGTPVIKGPQLERDSWMTAVDVLPTVTRQELRDRKKKEEKNDAEDSLLNKPGQHARELNPYWKDGGLGLPSAEVKKSKTSLSSHMSGDGGLSWLKRAYTRCEQKAKDEGISLDQAASETWGSLKKLQKMLKDAEKIAEKKERVLKEANQPENSRGSGSRSPSSEESRQRYRFQRPCADDEGDRKRSSGPRDYYKQDHRTRNHSRSPERNHSSRKTDRTRSRSRSSERDLSSRKYEKRRSRSRDRIRTYERDCSSREMDSRRRFMRPGQTESDSSPQTSAREIRSRGDSRKGFVRPGQMEFDSSSCTAHRSERDRNYIPSWKKQEYRRLEEDVQRKSDEGSNSHRRQSPADISPRHPRKISSSSEDSSSDSSDESDTAPEEAEEVKPVVVLTEEEMNKLSAKILKAEIMGDEELAEKLKVELEEARKIKAENKDAIPSRTIRHANEPEDVLLTVTDKRGMVRPLAEREHPIESGGRRRKKQKIVTHDKHGNRERYFDDDDKFDLKKMVEREKMGTAEDQNAMFARLAGKITEKTDEDHEVDDVLLIRSAQKQSDSKNEERERSKAIFEHRKMSAAIEKCQFCFENVTKHLIVALGMKVYLSLPNCRSLTEGHCLIVPMSHVAASTAVDEDVWTEIQVFRKALTKMFADRDLDVLFMEMSMNLKRFPHMCIECIPVPKEVGDMAPIYFKKAILESDTEWAQNKKLVDLHEKNIRRSVPKGLPYFSVDFGLQGGFAHVIEAEHLFPHYFGKEIIGGVLDVEHQLWRKPPRETFDDQRKKVLNFAEWWKSYDWTQKINRDNE